jgi:diguanylate cyclase (GGDEF)-like protein/PAS domain S-box-containing protein
LRESEARYRTIFETTGTATVIVEKDTTISLANAEFERLSGFSKEELEGKRNWAKFVAQDDREMLVQDHRLREAEPDVAPRHYEFQFTDRAGEIRDVFLTMALIPGTNQRVASFLDITKRKRAEEALREANRKIERLHEAAHRLEASNTEDELFRLTIEAAERILEFTMCQLGVVEESTLVTKAVSTGLPAEIRATMNLEAGLAREAHHTGKTHVCGNLAEAPQTQPARECFGSMITAPIGALGVFQVVSAEPNAFTEYDARLLELLLGHTAEALKRIRLQDKLQEQIIHDPLTGIYNRRYFNQMVETELQRSRRYRHSIGFLMIDVNRFKEINDNYGHQVGDRVLQAMGELFLDSVRASDIVVRYGGDEFLIMFTETNGEIDIVAQRIREAVARWNEDSSPIDFPVTLAMGASYWLPEAGEPLETVLQEADRRMYEDKRKQAATG